jgi:hypothetical protein
MMLYVHLKSGGVYTKLCEGQIEADLTDVIVYQSHEDKRVWVRPKDEFNERFIPYEKYSVAVDYALVDGAHCFTSTKKIARGLCVMHANLEIALNEVREQLKVLLYKNHSLKYNGFTWTKKL